MTHTPDRQMLRVTISLCGGQLLTGAGRLVHKLVHATRKALPRSLSVRERARARGSSAGRIDARQASTRGGVCAVETWRGRTPKNSATRRTLGTRALWVRPSQFFGFGIFQFFRLADRTAGQLGLAVEAPAIRRGGPASAFLASYCVAGQGDSQWASETWYASWYTSISQTPANVSSRSRVITLLAAA